MLVRRQAGNVAGLIVLGIRVIARAKGCVSSRHRPLNQPLVAATAGIRLPGVAEKRGSTITDADIRMPGTAILNIEAAAHPDEAATGVERMFIGDFHRLGNRPPPIRAGAVVRAITKTIGAADVKAGKRGAHAARVRGGTRHFVVNEASVEEKILVTPVITGRDTAVQYGEAEALCPDKSWIDRIALANVFPRLVTNRGNEAVVDMPVGGAAREGKFAIVTIYLPS